jgi:two-component system response regulator ChvI
LHTVAIIEDEPRIADNWAKALTDEGYGVARFYDAHAALAELAACPPDLLVLDIHLENTMPALDGYEVLRRLRGAWGDHPVKVLVVSAVRTDAIDELLAMKVADGYRRKEVGDAPLLVGHVEQLLRSVASAPAPRIGTCGPIRMDPAARTCELNGTRVPLNARSEWDITWRLLEKPGRIVSAEDLASAPNVAKDGISDIVASIRKKFRSIDPAFDAIRTVYGHGYKLEPAPVPKPGAGSDKTRDASRHSERST